MKQFFWSLLLITSLGCLGLSIRYLALHEMPLAQSLTIRGLACLFITVLVALANKETFVPKNKKTQIVRGLIAGGALGLFSLSYNTLPATIVSVLSQIDVPLIIILSSITSQSITWKSKWLSVFSIILLITLVLTLEKDSYSVMGIIYLLAGTVLLSIGYLLIKKSLAEESLSSTILTPGLSLVIYGLLIQQFTDQHWMVENSKVIFISIISGFLMYLSYIATAKLYALTSIAEAEFPTLISSLLLFPLEFYLLKQDFNKNEVLYSLGFLFLIYYTVKSQESENP